MSSFVTRADCINIVKGVLGDNVKTSIERSDERIRKLEEALQNKGDHALLSRFRGAGTSADNPMFGPANLQTRQVPKFDDAGKRVGSMVVEESAEEYMERHSGYGQHRSRLYPAGVGTGPIKDHRGIMAARLMRVALHTNGDLAKMAGVARSWNDNMLGDAVEELTEIGKTLAGTGTRFTSEFAVRAVGVENVAEARMRALGTNDLSAGGALVPAIYAAEILDILHAKTVIDSLGAMSLPLEGGEIRQAFMDTGVDILGVGENQGVNAGEPTFGELVLTGHELAAAVPVSNKLMASASVSVDAMIRNHLVMQFRKKMDLDCIRGLGTQNTVRGLEYWVRQASAAHRITRTKAGADSTVDEITEDLVKAIATVEGEDLPMDAGGWVMSTRDKYGLFRRRGSDGHLVFEPEMRAGVLWGFPFGATTQVPTTINTDKSVVYFGDFSTMVHAERGGIEVEAQRGAAYNNASGTVVAGASRRQTVVFANAEHDFGCLYRGKEVARIDTVDWGT